MRVLFALKKVLGHINGNAIYNNSDPAFVQFVDFTLARWDYTYSYDVALWATISDFPYSWPLWQRFSSKFVTTNLVRATKRRKSPVAAGPPPPPAVVYCCVCECMHGSYAGYVYTNYIYYNQFAP